MHLRFAEPSDCTSLLKIYAQSIDTPITFETALPSPEAFKTRMQTIVQAYPYLVCENCGRVLGYAYARRQMERAAYQWNAELSIYIDGPFVSKGLGTRLYQTLMEILKLQGVRNVYGGVTLPNPASERFHESLGFHRLGVYRKTGYKCGRWHDVAWFEKQIAPHGKQPAPFLPISALQPERLQAILQRYQST